MATYSPERRRAARIPCDIPVLLRCNGRSVEARSADLSRVGTRLRIPLDALGLAHDVQMLDLSREAMKVLGERLTLEFHHELLGDLVRRTARPVRFACAQRGQGYVEIGLDLRDPISDMEVEFLGVALPPLFEEVDPLPEASSAVSASGSTTTQDIGMVLCSEQDGGVPPLSGVPTYLGAGGAQADLGPRDSLPILVENPGAAGVMAALTGVYGGEPRTVLLMQSQAVWSGAVRLQAVDVRPADDRVFLEMAFARPIPEGARARLGL